MDRKKMWYLLKTVCLAIFVTACSKSSQVLISNTEKPEVKGMNDELRLLLDISQREVYVLKGADTLKKYPVAVGTRRYPTPIGEFNIHRIDWNPDWNPPESDWTVDKSYTPPGHPANPMGRVRIVYKMPYTLHGTKEVESLGKAASHGSVRMANEDVIELAKFLMHESGTPMPDEWFEEVLGNPKKMISVKLNRPVPLTNIR